MKCGNVKEGWEEANSRHDDLSRGSVWQVAPTSTLLKHSIKSITSRPPSLFRDSSWLATEACQVTAVILIPLSTKEFYHKGWGSQRPPHNVADAAPHQTGGSKTCQRATKTPRMAGAPRYNMVHLRTSSQGTTPCSLTLSRANLAPTLPKVC